jgi:hypothetical protein
MVVVAKTTMGWQRLADLVIAWKEQMKKILRETQRCRWLVDLVPNLVDLVLSLVPSIYRLPRERDRKLSTKITL